MILNTAFLPEVYKSARFAIHTLEDEQAVPGCPMEASRSALFLIEFWNFYTDGIVNEAQQFVIGWL